METDCSHNWWNFATNQQSALIKFQEWHTHTHTSTEWVRRVKKNTAHNKMNFRKQYLRSIVEQVKCTLYPTHVEVLGKQFHYGQKIKVREKKTHSATNRNHLIVENSIANTFARRCWDCPLDSTLWQSVCNVTTIWLTNPHDWFGDKFNKHSLHHFTI